MAKILNSCSPDASRTAKEEIGELHAPWYHYYDRTEETTFTLPDKQVITLQGEQFMCPEALFDPSILGVNSSGIHELIYESAMSCPPEIRPELFRNIALSGGSTLFPNFDTRLVHELTRGNPGVTGPIQQIKIVSCGAGRFTASWFGGSFVGSTTRGHRTMITRSEYEEIGPYVATLNATAKLLLLYLLFCAKSNILL